MDLGDRCPPWTAVSPETLFGHQHAEKTLGVPWNACMPSSATLAPHVPRGPYVCRVVPCVHQDRNPRAVLPVLSSQRLRVRRPAGVSWAALACLALPRSVSLYVALLRSALACLRRLPSPPPHPFRKLCLRRKKRGQVHRAASGRFLLRARDICLPMLLCLQMVVFAGGAQAPSTGFPGLAGAQNDHSPARGAEGATSTPKQRTQ